MKRVTHAASLCPCNLRSSFYDCTFMAKCIYVMKQTNKTFLTCNRSHVNYVHVKGFHLCIDELLCQNVTANLEEPIRGVVL